MTRRARVWPAAKLLGVVLVLAVVVGVGSVGPAAATARDAVRSPAAAPGALTRQYPLGTQTLCCGSGPSSGAGGSSATAAQGSSASPPRSATAGHRRSARPTDRRRAASGGSPAVVIWIAAIVLALLALLLGYRITRWRATQPPPPRPRRPVSRWVLILLWPVVRYSSSRDAYVLRLVGRRFGPVLEGSAPDGAPGPPSRPGAPGPPAATRDTPGGP